MEKINLNKVNKIYFVGIKGVAMTSLAILCKELGKLVSGSDTAEDFPTTSELSAHKIRYATSFDVKDMLTAKPDMVIYTGAHGGRINPQVMAAENNGIPILPHGKALGILMSGKKQISVAGSHGKTTTSAMLATILSHAGLDPSYAIGCGEIFGLGPAGHAGKSRLFIAEADEYMTEPGYDRTPRFAWQHPDILVVTNIDFDHPDAYRNLAEVKDAFKKLRNSMDQKGQLIINADDPESKFLCDTELRVTTVGLTPKADFQLANLHFGEGRTYFDLIENGVLIDGFLLQVPGRHNAVNAGQAAVTANLAGVSWPVIREGLAGFSGTKRRFEKLGAVNGITFFDDYAHHPKEILATLSSARAWYPKRRLVAVFQPHTYSRTKALLADFARAFKDADSVILTDIYASAREKEMPGVSGKILATETSKLRKSVYFAENPEKIKELLQENLQSGDIVIFMGAGDIYNWGREIVNNLKW